MADNNKHLGEIVSYTVADLKPHNQNAKNHPEDEVARLALAIERSPAGFTDPILVDEHGVIIAGHGRRLAVMKLGWTRVPARVISGLTEDQKEKLRINHNRVHGDSYDEEMLAEVLRSLEDVEDLEGIFTDAELNMGSIDLDDMNEDVFADDINGAVGDLEDENLKSNAERKSKGVPIADVLGFKTVEVDNQVVIGRFMKMVESETKLEGEAALSLWAQELMSA